MLDQAKNFAKVSVLSGYDASATSIALTSGHGARLPSVPFNAVWYDASSYADPSDDPNVEIVRVTARAGDNLTITRGQESTSASAKNTAGKTYLMRAGLTAKVINQDLAGSPYNVKAYGLRGDGVTDDTAALQALIDLVGVNGGGKIYFPKGEYLIGGGFQDPSGFNSQLTLPLSADHERHITIELVGEVAPPTAFYTETFTLPQKECFSIIKSTRTDGSGDAALIAGKPAPGTTIWDNVTLNVRDLVFAMPANPTYTCLNYSDIIGSRVENVLIYAGVVDFLSVTEPTHSNAYAIKTAPWNHSAEMVVNSLQVFGYYTACMTGELTWIPLLNSWACKVALEVPHNNYPVHVGTLGVMFTPYGIRSTTIPNSNTSFQQPGPAIINVDMMYLERAKVGVVGLAWQPTIYDIDDVAHNLDGSVGWSACQAGTTARIHTFYKRGAVALRAFELGIEQSLDYGLLFDSAEIGNVSTSVVAVTFSENVKAPDYAAGFTVTVNGTPATISSAARHSTKSVVRLTLSAPVANTDTVRVAYNADDGFLAAGDGTPLKSFNRGVVNNVSAATTMRILDRFVDTDKVRIISHVIAPTNVPATSWGEPSQSLMIYGNAAQAYGGYTRQWGVVTSGVADCIIRAYVARGENADSDAGLVFRHTNTSNYWTAQLRCTDDLFAIQECVSGTMTARASTAAVFNPNEEYEVEVVLSGTSITARLNGGSQITYTSSANQSATQHGIWTLSFAETRFRNFQVMTVS